MKWVACASRGAADPMSSHDLEDLITAMAGRAEIVDEVRGAPEPVRTFIRTETSAFLAASRADGILEGSLPDARRVPGLVDAVFVGFGNWRRSTEQATRQFALATTQRIIVVQCSVES